MRRLHNLTRVLTLVLALVAPTMASATEPLHDSLTVDEQHGPFFPEKCCWVDKLETRKFIEARMAEILGGCTAIGGPVGGFRLAEGKIWLIGLYKCGGSVPLKEIYPELGDPIFANWLNGVFFASLDRICVLQHDRKHVYRTELRLEVKNGVVTDTQRQQTDEAICLRDAGYQYGLGEKYRKGSGVTPDDAQAVEWYRKAADQGHGYAQYRLGEMYRDGRGIPQDKAQAAVWFRKAAEQRIPGAMEALRQMEASGSVNYWSVSNCGRLIEHTGQGVKHIADLDEIAGSAPCSQDISNSP